MNILEILSENENLSGSNHRIELTLDFSCSTNYSNKLLDNREKIIGTIRQKTGIGKIQLAKDFIELSIDDKNINKLELYQQQVYDIFHSLVDVENRFTFTEGSEEDQYVEIFLGNKVPKLPIPISYRKIYVTLTENTSLSGIDKMISSFRYLHIHGCEYATDKVLGIVNLGKKGHTIQLSTSDYKELKWMEIVDKYTKSKDVFACQEELIDNDLKDYAEL